MIYLIISLIIIASGVVTFFVLKGKKKDDNDKEPVETPETPIEEPETPVEEPVEEPIEEPETPVEEPVEEPIDNEPKKVYPSNLNESLKSLNNVKSLSSFKSQKEFILGTDCSGINMYVAELFLFMLKYFFYTYKDLCKEGCDPRSYILTLNSNGGCKGHPGASHTYKDFDVSYFTFGKTNVSQLGYYEFLELHGFEPRKDFVNLWSDPKTDKEPNDKLDWKRCLRFFQTVVKFFPECRIMLDARIFNYIHKQVKKEMGIDSEDYNWLTNNISTRFYLDSPMNYNHHAHAHISLWYNTLGDKTPVVNEEILNDIYYIEE